MSAGNRLGVTNLKYQALEWLLVFRAGFLQTSVRMLLCRNTKIGLCAACPISWPAGPFQVSLQLCSINFLLLKWGKCLRGREAAQPSFELVKQQQNELEQNTGT